LGENHGLGQSGRSALLSVSCAEICRKWVTLGKNFAARESNEAFGTRKKDLKIASDRKCRAFRHHFMFVRNLLTTCSHRTKMSADGKFPNRFAKYEASDSAKKCMK
jgi:hypothetical protein